MKTSPYSITYDEFLHLDEIKQLTRNIIDSVIFYDINNNFCKISLDKDKKNVIKNTYLITLAELGLIDRVISGKTIDKYLYLLLKNGSISFVYDISTRKYFLKEDKICESPYNFSIDFKDKVLFLKDSRFISDGDRKIILEKCKSCKNRNIIITHGSFTMAETAKFLLNQNINKTVVLVGSITPINKNKSDALFNLGSAITAVQLLKNGVYIAMNGQIFTANNVQKNQDKVLFEKEF